MKRTKIYALGVGTSIFGIITMICFQEKYGIAFILAGIIFITLSFLIKINSSK